MSMFRKLLLAAAFLLVALPANAASRFWVGGAGTWDGSSTTNWSATSGGAGGQSVPGSADTVTFDGSSGGGTVVINTNFSIVSLTVSGFTGTLDNSVNNNSPSFVGSFTITASAAVAFKCGSGTYTFTGSSSVFGITTPANLTTTCGSESWNYTSTTQDFAPAFNPNGKSVGSVTVGGLSGSTNRTNFGIGTGTYANLTLNGPRSYFFTPVGTVTITNAFNWNASGSASAMITLGINNSGSSEIISVASGTPTINWATIAGTTFQGGATFSATNSFDMKGNSGITITNPSVGSGGGHIIGGN